MWVSLEQAQRHLRLDTTGATWAQSETEADVLAKLAAAEDVVRGYLDNLVDRADTVWAAELAAWTSEDPAPTGAVTTPPRIVAAVLLQLGELWRYRGDDADGPAAREPGDLSPTIKALLRRDRDPTLA